MTSTCPKSPRRQSAFTLVEVMVASTIASFVLAGILSSFLFLGRSGANLANYATMEQEARKGLDRFSQDVRMSKNITWTSSSSVTLTVPHTTGGVSDTVTYSWDTSTASSTYHCFIRNGPDPVTAPITGATVGASATTVLIHNVTSFEFDRWMIGSTGEATNDVGTKQLQIRLTVTKTATTAVAASNLVVSARFILRNKA